MEDREKVQRFPLWVSKIMGLGFLVGSVLFVPGVWQILVQDGLTVETVYTLIVCVLFFSIGLALLLAKKGLPKTWRDTALLLRQTQEEPDGLNEALPPEERLEHLKIMLEQGVLSQEEYNQKRQNILKGL